MANLKYVKDGQVHSLPVRNGVSSINGETGVVQLDGNSINVSDSETTPKTIAEEISSLKENKLDKTGVKVAGTALTPDESGSVNIPTGAVNTLGVVKSGNSVGIAINNGELSISKATNAGIDNKAQQYTPIVPSNLDYAVRAGLLSNSQITDADKAAICGTIGAQPRYTAQTITIAASAWSNNSVTVNVTGVTADNLVQLSVPTKADMDKFGQAGVFCSAQGAGTLTFTCVHTPTDSITVNAVIWG